MKQRRIIHFAFIVTTAAMIALNLWITPGPLESVLTVGRWFLYGILGFLGLSALVSSRGKVRPPVGWGFLAFFLGIAIMSTTWSLVPDFSLARALSVVLLIVGVTFFGAAAHTLDGGFGATRIFAVCNVLIVGASSAMGAVSIGSLASGFFQGPFGNPNGLGSALAITMPFTLVQREILRPHRGQLKISIAFYLLTASAAGSVLLLFLSRSRTSVIALVPALLIVGQTLVSKERRVIIAAAVVTVLVAMIVPSRELAEESREFVFKGGEVVFASRAETIEDTLHFAKERPLMGYGFGISADMTSGGFWRGGYETPIGAAREKTNAYIGLVEEVGLVGTVPLVIGLLIPVVMGFRRLFPMTRPDPVALGFLASVVAGLVHVNGEAWLTSAGSLEAFWFWWQVGVLGSPALWRRVAASRAVAQTQVAHAVRRR